MRKFIVNVNGTSYEVEVEELSGAQTTAPASQVVAPAPQVTQAPAADKAPTSKPVAAGAGETVSAPMPGNILDVKVHQGDKVKSGDVLLVLEAMKMENEILAPKDGVVVSVSVAKGSTVNSGDALCVIG